MVPVRVRIPVGALRRRPESRNSGAESGIRRREGGGNSAGDVELAVPRDRHGIFTPTRCSCRDRSHRRALSPVRVVLLRVAGAAAHVSCSVENECDDQGQAERPRVVVPEETADKSQAGQGQHHPVHSPGDRHPSPRSDHQISMRPRALRNENSSHREPGRVVG
ncbi:hypothetical protein FVP33_05845 [Lacisediminihabitans profunda]|uniref:Uncharacterized protein n=1 Tax=Lacisediminihabitans profunda TaxID=2594790 RepID=A0A5C8UVF1_9MICO|nr:hypothetical protein FVP33_05845 [Lacisediminihabitans profunda]